MSGLAVPLAVSAQGKDAKRERWVPGLKSRSCNDTVRVLCFPYAGGGASAFNYWTERGQSLFQACAVQYPGRESRWGESGFESLRAMVDAITDDLSPFWEEPFAFWGHSFGALVAFEVARSLFRLGCHCPLCLFISAARAPHLPRRAPIHHLPEAEFLEKVREFNGMSDEVLKNRDLLSVVLPIIQSDFRLFEQHQVDDLSPLPIPLSVFGGLQDAGAPIGDLLAWSAHTSKTFRSRFFEGHHFFLLESGTRDRIARCIEEDLQVFGSSPNASAVGTGASVNE